MKPRIQLICWILLGLNLAVVKVSSSGVFELELKSLTNQGLNSEGSCCSGVRRPPGSGSCTGTCRTFFRICLNHFQNHISENPPCTFGSLVTDVLGENSFRVPAPSELIRLPFDFYWPGTFTLIIEAWHDATADGPAPGSPRDLVLREKVGRSVQVGEDWSHFSYTPPTVSSMKLDYKYRVVCDEDYYGPGCSTVCRPRDDGLGHYSCTQNGTKVCLEGWTGPYCDKAICLPGCHPTNGICDNPNECQCRLGWQGNLCDKCIPYPGCQHGTCSQPWECKCGEGWGGLFCNQDLNYCTHYTPCKNGATCTNTGEGSYTCSCPPGTTGTNCEISVDDCQNLPCQNGGTCKDVGNSYECQCPHGFHGRHCDTTATSCEESPCKHGASCISYVGSYKCMCKPGFTGVNCDSDSDECASNPCQNDGRCVDEFNGFRCVCKTGFSGPTCARDNNDCSNNTCLNGGTCDDRINDFECRCVPGFVGPLCQTNVDDCENKPCANGGTCHDLVNDFMCDCAPGFSDKDCRRNIDECAGSPCLNGGTCQDLINLYQCKCPPGYLGNNCEYLPGVIPHYPTGGAHQSSTTGSDVTGTKTPVVGHSDATTTTSIHGMTSEVSADKSMVTMQQLLLIICLGVGIPITIIIIIIVFLLCNRRRTNNSEDSTNVHKENEENMNNHLKCIDTIDTIVNQIPTSLKLTNEAQDSTRTFDKAKKQLNLDKVGNDKSSNKTFLKDFNTARYLHVHNTNTTDIIQKCNRIDESTKNNSLERESTPVESTSVDISSLHTAADIHHVQNSILYLEKSHRHQQEYSEGMLATEV